MIQTVITAGLAGTRLARAWMYEEIGEPVREPIEKWSDNIAFAPIESPDGSIDVIVTEPPAMLTLKTWVNGLVTCPHCIGAHFSFWAAVGLRYRATRPLVIGLAAATIMSAFADLYPGFNPEEGDED